MLTSQYFPELTNEKVNLHCREDEIDSYESSFQVHVLEKDNRIIKTESTVDRTVYKQSESDSIRETISKRLAVSSACQMSLRTIASESDSPSPVRRFKSDLKVESSAEEVSKDQDDQTWSSASDDSKKDIELETKSTNNAKCNYNELQVSCNQHSKEQTSKKSDSKSQTTNNVCSKNPSPMITYQKTPHPTNVEKQFPHLNGFFDYVFCEKQLIGEGGFGEVYRATHKLEQKLYAIKKVKLQLKEGEDIRQNKIFREVAVMISFNHPNIVRHHTTWTEQLNSEQRQDKTQITKLKLSIQNEVSDQQDLIEAVKDHTRISDLGFEWELDSKPNVTENSLSSEESREFRLDSSLGDSLTAGNQVTYSATS